MNSEPMEEAYCTAGQAADVLQMAANYIGTSDVLWGLQYLAELFASQVREASGSDDCIQHKTASRTAAGLLGLMEAIDAEEHGDGVFYGAQSLVRVAKDLLDGQVEAIAKAGKITPELEEVAA